MVKPPILMHVHVVQDMDHDIKAV